MEAGNPHSHVNTQLTRTILPAAALLLLSALVLPGTPRAFAAKDVFLADAALCAHELPQGLAGRCGGDDQEFSLPANVLAARLPALAAAFAAIPARAPEFAHTVSQARAPPAP